MADQNSFGTFYGLTDSVDANQIFAMDVSSAEFKDFLVRLRETMTNMILVLNTKESGYYVETSFLSGKLFYPDTTSSTGIATEYRPMYRVVVDTGPLANTGTTNTAHGITLNSTLEFVHIYGAATDPSTGGIPLPQAGPNPVQVTVDATNVNITTSDDKTGYTSSYIVLEYITY